MEREPGCLPAAPAACFPYFSVLLRVNRGDAVLMVRKCDRKSSLRASLLVRSDRMRSHGRDGTVDLLGATGKRGRQGDGSSSTVRRLNEPRAPSDWTSATANGVFQGKENHCLSASAAAAATLCVRSCRPVPSGPRSQQKTSVSAIQLALFGSIRVQIKIKIGQGSIHPPGQTPPVHTRIEGAYSQLLTRQYEACQF